MTPINFIITNIDVKFHENLNESKSFVQYVNALSFELFSNRLGKGKIIHRDFI